MEQALSLGAGLAVIFGAVVFGAGILNLEQAYIGAAGTDGPEERGFGCQIFRRVCKYWTARHDTTRLYMYRTM